MVSDPCSEAALEKGILDNATNAAEIRVVLEEIIRKAHEFTASDLDVTGVENILTSLKS
jgi:hypothetical protein